MVYSLVAITHSLLFASRLVLLGNLSIASCGVVAGRLPDEVDV